MEGFNRSTRPGQRSGTERTYRKQRDNSNPPPKKLPPFGKGLSSRLAFGNKPFLVIVCVGKDAWDDAKIWQQQPDDEALVLPAGVDPNALNWPVSGCHCVIEWSSGPSADFIEQLGICLLRAGATEATVWDKNHDASTPSMFYDTSKPRGERWQQLRAVIGTMKVKGRRS